MSLKCYNWFVSASLSFSIILNFAFPKAKQLFQLPLSGLGFDTSRIIANKEAERLFEMF